MMALLDRIKLLPVLLVFLFVSVAVIDLVHHQRQPPQPLPDLLGGNSVVFEAWEPTIDFRVLKEAPVAEILPRPRFLGRGWSAPGRGGVWIRKARARLELHLARGGQRLLVLECLPAEGQRPVRVLQVAINGESCGSLDLDKGRRTYSLELPDGVIRGGANRIAFFLPDREEAQMARRALLLRRLALVGQRGEDSGTLRLTSPLDVDLEKRRVTIKSSGRLSIPFTVDDRIDALRMRCRINGGEGRCEVVVARPQGSGPGYDPAVRRIVDSEQQRSDRVRVPLHGRRGEFLLTVDAELEPGSGRLIVTAPELVKDTGFTLRPPAG